MAIFRLKDNRPSIDPSAYMAPDTTVIGKVTIAKDSSVWFNCVLRGDADTIVVGRDTNIQDLCVLHTDPGKPVIIGNRVTIGHRSIIHGCEIEDYCLIGMGSIIMNGAKIRRGSIVAAGSVILEDTVIPPFSLVAGVPGKVKRTMEENVLEEIHQAAQIYVDRIRLYQKPGALVRLQS